MTSQHPCHINSVKEKCSRTASYCRTQTVNHKIVATPPPLLNVTTADGDASIRMMADKQATGFGIHKYRYIISISAILFTSIVTDQHWSQVAKRATRRAADAAANDKTRCRPTNRPATTPAASVSSSDVVSQLVHHAVTALYIKLVDYRTLMHPPAQSTSPQRQRCSSCCCVCSNINSRN